MGLVAAEIVAALVDGNRDDLPDEIEAMVARRKPPAKAVVAAALKALDIVAGESDLRGVLEEGSELDDEFLVLVKTLKQRLGASDSPS